MNKKPKMSKSTYMLLGALGLVLLVIQGMDGNLKKARARNAASQHPTSGGPQVSGAPVAVSAAGMAPSAVPDMAVAGALRALDLATWGEDPFWRAAARHSGAGRGRGIGTAPEEEPTVLKGIVWAGSGSTAQLNHEFVRTGDKVGGWTVARIDPASVTLTRGALTRTLQLHGETK